MHISMAIRGAEKPHNNSITCTVCFSCRGPGSAGSHTWYYQDPICAPCGLQGTWGKGLMRDLWHPTWGLQAPTGTENSQPIHAYLWEKIRHTLYLRKHWNTLNTNTFTLEHSLWNPKCRHLQSKRYFKEDSFWAVPGMGGCQSCKAAQDQGGNRVGVTWPCILTVPER